MNEKINTLFSVLDELCVLSGRNIYVILPEKEELQAPYLKQEIQKCLDLL
jgi:hypothetical protein